MVEREARARLGPVEADAFLTRLDQLSFDILEPLTQVYGAGADAIATVPMHVHSSTGRMSISSGRIELPPWSFLWLAGT